MINLIKIISTEKDNLARLVVKFLRFGKGDVLTAKHSAPYGVDSNPIADMVAVYSTTKERGKGVVVGYINKNQLAEVGELRLFSTDSNGNEQFYTWLKNDGTMEIGGDTDNMVRFSELKTAFDELKNDFNTFVNTYNSHIHVTTATVGATPTPGVISATVSTGTPTAADINPAKIDEIKTL